MRCFSWTRGTAQDSCTEVFDIHLARTKNAGGAKLRPAKTYLPVLIVCALLQRGLKADVFDVYLLTGQSNSLGTTNLEDPFDPGFHPADGETDFYWSNVSTSSTDPNNIVLLGDSEGGITTLQMQQGAAPSPNFWGPEFGLARTLWDGGQPNALVIKVSRGGGGNSAWLPSSGHMHNHFLTEIETALTALQDAGHAFDVRGLMYLQGESNNATEANLADVRLSGLIDSVQSHINANFSNAASEMYSVAAEIAASQSNANRMTSTARQRALGSANNHIAFFETRDLAVKSDGLHFGRGAKLEIGRRFADAFHSQSWIEDPRRLGGYSANVGSLQAIPHPVAQGYSEMAEGNDISAQGFNDAGTPAWRTQDNNLSEHVDYRQTLTSDDFHKMFTDGWTFQVTAKVVSGGGLALWSIGQNDDPGWGLDFRTMNGFELERVNGDELAVHLWQEESTTVNLGPGSADAFHSFEIRGAAGTRLFDFYVDGILRSSGHDLRDGLGILGVENQFLFASDLTIPRAGPREGVGMHDVYWNELSLHTVPEPATHSLVALSVMILLLSNSPITQRV